MLSAPGLAFALCISAATAAGATAGPSTAGRDTIRFCPGEATPIAYDYSANTYIEGGSFDPLVCAEEPCFEVLHNIFEPLVSIDENQTAVPVLATRWEQTSPTVYRFWLRRGVVFHNGEPFDADSVVFSLQRSSDIYNVTAWFPKLVRVEAVDPYTVETELAEPDSLFLHRLSSMALMQPAHYFNDAGAEAFGKRPVGTGPFRFASWNRSARKLRLEAHAAYWRHGFPKAKHLEYHYLNTDQAYNKLIAGELDLVRRLNPRRTTDLLTNGRGRIVKAWLPQVVLGAYNLFKKGPLRDERVRRAINLAVNRNDLIRYGASGNGRPLKEYTVDGDPNGADLKVYEYNPEEARRLLREAGITKGFSLEFWVDNQVPPQIENIISENLKGVNITARFKRSLESEFVREIFLPKFQSAAPAPRVDLLLFSVPLGTLSHSAAAPVTLLYSRKPNESLLRDDNLDKLYERGLREGVRSPAWRELEEYTRAHDLLFVGYQERAVFGAAKDLHFVPRTLMSFWDAYYEDAEPIKSAADAAEKP